MFRAGNVRKLTISVQKWHTARLPADFIQIRNLYYRVFITLYSIAHTGTHTGRFNSQKNKQGPYIYNVHPSEIPSSTILFHVGLHVSEEPAVPFYRVEDPPPHPRRYRQWQQIFLKKLVQFKTLHDITPHNNLIWTHAHQLVHTTPWDLELRQHSGATWLPVEYRQFSADTEATWLS
jgi:hypothetical protein